MCSTSVVHRVNLRASQCQPPWFIVSTSVVHRVNLRGSSCQPPWFIVSTSVVHSLNLRGSQQAAQRNILERAMKQQAGGITAFLARRTSEQSSA
ncbi:hypothetical protein SAMN05444288_2202 [Hoylesella oralis]|nr:hypothetical protein SAMN05444288_2202 [Hoylesella oralis]